MGTKHADAASDLVLDGKDHKADPAAAEQEADRFLAVLMEEVEAAVKEEEAAGTDVAPQIGSGATESADSDVAVTPLPRNRVRYGFD